MLMLALYVAVPEFSTNPKPGADDPSTVRGGELEGVRRNAHRVSEKGIHSARSDKSRVMIFKCT